MLLPYIVACFSCVLARFVRGLSFLSMPTTCPTFNSLSADLFPADLFPADLFPADLFPAPSTSAPPSSGDSVGVLTVGSGTSNSLSNEIVVAVAQVFQQSLPSFVTALRAENLAAPVSSKALPPVSSVVSSIVSGSAMVAASSLSSVAGTLRLLPFVSMFPAISSTPGSCSARLAHSIAAPFMASHVTSFSLHGVSLAASGDKSFVVGPGHVPIPMKLVKKITKKRWLVEVEDILTWTEAFTIYQMVICASHPHHLSDLTKYKLLII